MEQSKKKILHTVIAMTILAAVVISGFYFLTKRQESRGGEGAAAKNEVDKIIAKDLENNYPGTPREVLKLYGRITKCLYGEKINDEQLKKLASQIRMLFDSELLESNPEDEYIQDLKAEIKEYNVQKKVIVSYIVQKNSSVKKSTVEGKEYAEIVTSYMLRDKTGFSKTYEEFMLRQDDMGHWKILGWRLLEPEDVDEDEL